MRSVEESCMNYDGDEDCYKCCKHGYIFSCAGCDDYVDFFGNHKKPKEYWEDDNES